MALNPQTPGVYIEEISTLPPSVAPVGTAIPAFIGYTKNGLSNTAMSPVRIESLLEYESIFGGPVVETFKATLTTAAVNIAILRQTSANNQNMNLYYHLQMYFGNGGGPCYIISAGKYGDTFNLAHFSTAIVKAEEADEITLLVVPEAINLTTAGDRLAVYTAMLTQCDKLQDRFSILDVEHTGTIAADASGFRTDDVGTGFLKYGAAYYPPLNTVLPLIYDDASVLIDAQDATLPVNVQNFDGLTLADMLNGYLTSLPDVGVYNRIKTALETRLTLYPCSAMAGIYAAVDRDRGVWKAPANVSVNLISGLAVTINDDDQEGLNVDPVAGKSINAIRKFNGRGLLVWGARTLDGNSNEWRYVNVRRLFIMVEESCKKASEFVVFEPNDKNTWLRVKGMISNFLTNMWRAGALAGDKPEQAFFVKVGLNETMTAQDILEGKLIVQVGMAAVRPAEFIILQFMHKLQEA
jgi:phage tail sheath protein FI